MNRIKKEKIEMINSMKEQNKFVEENNRNHNVGGKTNALRVIGYYEEVKKTHTKQTKERPESKQQTNLLFFTCF